MEMLGGSDACTSNHQSGTANGITIPLDTIPKAYEGPTALGHDWTHLSQRVQINNRRRLAHHQSNNESCLRQSMVSVTGQAGQSRNPGCTTSFQRQNYPQHNLKHFSSNDRLPVTSETSKKLLHQKGPAMLSSSFEHQNKSPSSMTTNMTPQSMPRMILLNSNNLNGNWKNSLSNQQQHVKTVNSLPKDAICQGLFTDVGHFGVILAPTQTIQICQENAYMSKDVHQQKLMPQKAIAVVTPLTQDVVAGDTFSNNVNKVKEGVLETRFVPDKNGNHISHMVQSRKNESCVKTWNDDAPQTKGAPVIATRVMGSAENTTFPGQSHRLSLTSISSVSTESKLTTQPFPTVDNYTVTWRHNETTLDVRLDKLSAIPVNEWTLQRLRSLVTDMEQIQKRHQKNIPCNDLSREIIKLYWNGHYQNFCSAAKSGIYINIMKEVEHHCGRKNSVIFQAVSKETLNEVASRFHILEHGIVPPKTDYTSSWLNLCEELYELDKGHDRLSSLVTLQPEPKVADQEVPVKEIENIHEPSNEMVKVSDEALRGGEKQSKPPEHQKSFCVKADIIAQKEQEVMIVENKCSVKEMEGQVSMAVNSVMRKEVQSEKKNKTVGENEAPLSISLTTQSSDVSEISMTPGNLLPTTDLTPVMDKDGPADCISEEMSILPPEKDKSLVAGEPDKEVNNILKADAQILRNNKGPSTVELIDQDRMVMGTKIKSDERQSRIIINSQVENYCCLAKWFHILGYRNGGHCNCEKKAELGHHADTSGKGVKKIKVNKHRHSLKEICNLNDTETSVLRDERRAKKRLGYRSMTGKKSVTSPIDDDDDSSMDEIKIVDVITNSEDVLKLINTVSEHLMETPRASSSHESTSVRKPCRITTPEFKTGNRQINLALFGTSHLRQKKNISVFTSSDTVPLPPETINVRIDSGWNEHSNSTKRQTSKQQVWNSWKKTHVPLKMSTKRKSKNQKHTKAPESKNDAAHTSVIKTAVLNQSTTFPLCKDAQKRMSEASADKQRNTSIGQSKKKSRRKELCTKNDKIKELKRKKMLTSFNLSKRWNYANNASKLMKSSFHPAQDINTSKHKLNLGSALNFNVLPESFNISDDTSSSYQMVLQVNRSASTDSTKKVQPVVQVKRPWNMSGTWCDSPRKKKCLKPTSTIPNTSGTSTFQEFKKKYEEKKQGIPP